VNSLCGSEQPPHIGNELELAGGNTHLERLAGTLTQVVSLISANAAHAWYEWAAEIAMENLSAETVREVILDFIRKLVSFRFLE
jgi:hypothetical protein